MDFSNISAITIPEGIVTKIESNGVVLWQVVQAEAYKNWVKYSTEADGVTIYNGGIGCMYGYRMNSSGAVKEAAGANHTGYIPMTFGDVIRATGTVTSNVGSNGHYFTVYDETFTRIATVTMSNMLSASFCSATYTQQADGLYMMTIDTTKAGQYMLENLTNAKYFRISFSECETENFVVTINEEII